MACRCYIVPPHLLRGIAESTVNSEGIRKAAEASIAVRERISAARQERLAALARPRGYSRTGSVNFTPQHIVPDFLLRHVAESEHVDEATRARAQRDLGHLEEVLNRVKTTQQGMLTKCHYHANT
jgi:hypothetical protein